MSETEEPVNVCLQQRGRKTVRRSYIGMKGFGPYGDGWVRVSGS